MLLGAAGRIPGDWRDISPEGLSAAAVEGFAVLNVVVNDPLEMNESDIRRLKRMFTEAGLVIGQTNGGYGAGLISFDEAQRKRTIEFVRGMCRLTARLSAENTYLRPGSVNAKGAWLPHLDNRSDQVFDLLVESTKDVARTAEAEGVTLAVEGGAVSPLYSARRVGDFLDAVGSPALGFNQDPVNFIGSLDDVYHMTSFLSEFFRLLGDVTVGAHAKDFCIVDQLMVRFEEVEIGLGMMDHELFLKEMQRVCPGAHVLLEHLPPDRFVIASQRYRKIASQAGIDWGTALST